MIEIYSIFVETDLDSITENIQNGSCKSSSINYGNIWCHKQQTQET